MKMKKIITLIIILLIPALLSANRIKDISSIRGVRSNQLIGYGLVIGLEGTGDKTNTGFTMQTLSNALERMGISVDSRSINVQNIAAVIVTANLPAFPSVGESIDVTVSSIGDATSLQGGTLLLTPLMAQNSAVYAVAQGTVSIGGFNEVGGGAGGQQIRRNHPTVGRIPNGAVIEREVPSNILEQDNIIIVLNNADFTTAINMVERVNAEFNRNIAKALDSKRIEIKVLENYKGNVPLFISRIETLRIDVDQRSKVVVNERTGTIVIGKNVRIKKCAIAHGNLQITIKSRLDVHHPYPYTTADTVVTEDIEIQISEEEAQLMVIEEAPTIGELVKALNAIGVSPRDMISIFQALKQAGALDATLEIL